MIVPYPFFLTEWIKSSLEKLSEKGFERHSNPKFCRYWEHKVGQRGTFGIL